MQAARAYVAFMMKFIARGLCAASRVDEVVRQELSPLPAGFTFEMSVLPAGPALRLRKRDDGTFVSGEPADARPDLAIRFKHLRHAMASFTFQEPTARSFADDRMVVDGDPALAMRMQRMLDRLLVLTLPHRVAEKALLRVPDLKTVDKARAAGRLWKEMVAP
ncbi:MAG: hypothetical protein HYV09_03800 [Deltaproteobacteria bacterium]|nr:hypothetical protein [Deltaproteobacteria bacterium]